MVPQHHPNYGLARSQEEARDEESVINPLPRAVQRPNEHLLLDGEWKFSIDRDDTGIFESWHLGHEYKHTAIWPGSIEEHMAEAKGSVAGAGWTDKVVAWYEREFTLPELNEDSIHQIWQLTFGACGYETRVWLNGIAMKTIEGEEVHLG